LRYKARFPQIPDGSARCGRFCCYSTYGAVLCGARHDKEFTQKTRKQRQHLGFPQLPGLSHHQITSSPHSTHSPRTNKSSVTSTASVRLKYSVIMTKSSWLLAQILGKSLRYYDYSSLVKPEQPFCIFKLVVRVRNEITASKLLVVDYIYSIMALL
jgi:hypothetical protein